MGEGLGVRVLSSQPKVAVLIPQPMRQSILSPATEADLASFAEVASGATAEQLPELLDGAVACLTGWGTPPLPDDVLRKSGDLRLVAHTAGSIHKLVPAAALARGLRVSHAAAIIADSVIELVLGQTLRFLRHLDVIDREMKAGAGWMEIRNAYPGRLLGEQTVGVVGTGYVGRKVIQGFQAFGCRILVSDPFLSDAQASELGVTKVDLPELFAASDIVSLHAPALPETGGLVSADLLRQLPAGALLINTARGALVDEDALLAELASGRISAILDVFRTEPLPAESPFRALSNVFLSPHAAGHTIDTHWRQGQAMVDEIRRLLSNQPLRYEIAPERLATMA
jgi:phosphoglycerate dehydrogenase-like enzyme